VVQGKATTWHHAALDIAEKAESNFWISRTTGGSQCLFLHMLNANRHPGGYNDAAVVYRCLVAT
jgi:hypothetical protein